MDEEAFFRVGPPVLRDLIQSLQEWTEVLALRLGGSVARGQADDFSDLELYAACTQFPPRIRRQQCIVHWRDPGTAFLIDEAGLWGVLDTFCGAGKSIMVVFQQVATIERGLGEILSASDLDREKEIAFGHEMIGAQILYDAHGLAARWRAQARTYPSVRRTRILHGLRQWQQNLAPELAGTQDDPLWAAFRLEEAWEWLVHGLCALHGRYYGGPKRALAHLASFVERPRGAWARLAESWQTALSPHARHAVWQQIVEEVLAEGTSQAPLPDGGGEIIQTSPRIPGGGPKEPSFKRPPARFPREHRKGWEPFPRHPRTQALGSVGEEPQAAMDPAQAALLQAFYRGCDCVMERLPIAAQRGDAAGFLFYQHKTLEAFIQVLGRLQGGGGKAALTPDTGARPLRHLSPAPPDLYNRLCHLWSGSYQAEELGMKWQQWGELWREMIPLIHRRFPALDLGAGEQAFYQALSRD